jgi:hypothetical protein
MKSIYLTIDYELFLGNNTGAVLDCMVKPTEELLRILAINNSKMTVFWDILHYRRCLDYVEIYPSLQNDIDLIKSQIVKIIELGHDVQLHLHPHWLDAIYNGEKWEFLYDHFSLCSLDETSLKKCILGSIELINSIIKPIKNDYMVRAFRAGGYLIEPFFKVSKIFENTGIFIDSSVCPNMINNGKISPFDFRGYPAISKYKFTASPKILNDNGKFIEYPIKTITIPYFRDLYFKIYRKFYYPKLESGRKGTGVGNISCEESFRSKLINVKRKLFSNQYQRTYMLTTDSMFYEKFKYLLKQSNDNDVMILHPKLLNSHNLEILEKMIRVNDLKLFKVE